MKLKCLKKSNLLNEGSYLKTCGGGILKQKPRYFDNHEGYEKSENRVL